jgi:hypothetical protein
VERFGENYLTVFNDSPDRKNVTITLENDKVKTARELLTGRTISWTNQQTSFYLNGEDVAVIKLE